MFTVGSSISKITVALLLLLPSPPPPQRKKQTNPQKQYNTKLLTLPSKLSALQRDKAGTYNTVKSRYLEPEFDISQV